MDLGTVLFHRLNAMTRHDAHVQMYGYDMVKPKPDPLPFKARALKADPTNGRYLYPQTLVGGEYGKFTYEKEGDTHAIWTFETEKGRDTFVKHYAKSLEASPL